MASLKAQTPSSHLMESAAGYAMSQPNAARAYYGALLENPNVQAGLATLRAAEATAKSSNPYSVDFGGGQLSSLDSHPGTIKGFTDTNGKKNRTTAAGAYQFLSGTWKEVSKKLGLKDFSPVNQDIAALGLIDKAGALANLVEGDLAGFIGKVNSTWASLPGAPYAQPTRSWGFIENAWNSALDAIRNPAPSLPDTAPTPYGPDSQMADMTPGAPIGTVTRSPLGPATPTTATGLFSGMATPRGVNTPTATPADAMRGLAPAAPAQSTPGLSPSASAVAAAQGLGAVSQAAQVTQSTPSPASMSAAPSGSFTSQDEKTNTGSIANAPNSGNFTSQDERASLSERLGLDPATGIAPASQAVAPTAPATVAPSIAAPKISVPAAVPNVQKMAVPAAAVSRPGLAAPSQPSLSPSDVYGGAIGTAQTSTPGTTVSRVSSFGPSYTTNKFGAVTATAPDGTQMAALGGIPSAPPSNISGPLGNTATQAAPSSGLGGMFGPKAKTATGAIAGAALGSYALGPLGGLLGGLIGKNIAQGKAPLSGLLGGTNSLANTHVVDTFEGPMRAANAVGGLGFPGKPSGPAPGGVAAGMRGLSPGAANAIDHGVGGLY